MLVIVALYTIHPTRGMIESMMEYSEIEKLASLSRLEMSEDEKKLLLKDFESILGYISDIQNAGASASDEIHVGRIHNVMRPDTDAHETGVYTESLLAQMPDTKDGALRVKKIL